MLPLPAAAGETFERWSIVKIDGQPAGHMHEQRRVDGPHLITTSEMRLRLSRAGARVVMAVTTEFVETDEHAPVRIRVERSGTDSPTATTWIFEDDHIGIRSGSNGERESTRPIPAGTWLTPAQADEYLARRLRAGADEITLRTIDPASGPDPISLTYAGIAPETVEISGRKLEAHAATVRSSASPGLDSRVLLDAEGRPLRHELRLGAVTLTIVASDRETALADTDAPELLLGTFVRPDRPIAAPRRLRTAAFTLSVPDGELFDPPETAIQRIERTGPDSVRVTIKLDSPRPMQNDESDNRRYLAASTQLDHEDPAVAELVRSTRRASREDDPAATAEALRRAVHRHVRHKDLGVGFTTASDTARSRRGDCTGHAMLLAAALRAEQIPARIVSGLVYADRFAGQRDTFVYHMWTQALLVIDDEPTWIDLDATLPSDTPITATHIALATSALNDEDNDALLPVAALLGRLRISVEHTDR